MTRMVVDISSALAMLQATIATRAHGVVVSHPLRMRKALGSNPSASKAFATRPVSRGERVKESPTVGLEPTTTRLRALRSAG